MPWPSTSHRSVSNIHAPGYHQRESHAHSRPSVRASVPAEFTEVLRQTGGSSRAGAERFVRRDDLRIAAYLQQLLRDDSAVRAGYSARSIPRSWRDRFGGRTLQEVHDDVVAQLTADRRSTLVRGLGCGPAGGRRRTSISCRGRCACPRWIKDHLAGGGIPPGSVASPLNTPGIRGRRALPDQSARRDLDLVHRGQATSNLSTKGGGGCRGSGSGGGSRLVDPESSGPGTFLPSGEGSKRTSSPLCFEYAHVLCVPVGCCCGFSRYGRYNSRPTRRDTARPWPGTPRRCGTGAAQCSPIDTSAAAAVPVVSSTMIDPGGMFCLDPLKITPSSVVSRRPIN